MSPRPPRRPPRRPPTSIRFTPDQQEELRARAEDRPIAQYVKSVLFPDFVPAPREAASPSRPRPTADKQMLGELLAKLGLSAIFQSMAALAREAEAGVLIMGDEEHAALRQACADLREIRQTLMNALGKTAGAGPEHAPVCSEAERGAGL